MPPNKSNKRGKLAASPLTDATPIPTNSATSSKAFTNSTCKALELPLELLMEIISYHDHLPLPTTTSGLNFRRMAPESSLERTDALRVLSQTCKLWRDVFYPLVWERFEVCATHSESGAWYKVLGQSLIRKSILVSNNPEIAAHVRVMTVSLTGYSTSTVLPALVQAIKALPNLHTFHIARSDYKLSKLIRSAFEGHEFPQIRTIMLPTWAHHIMACFPETRTIICKTGDDASPIVTAIAKVCRKVEHVIGLRPNANAMRRLVKAAPDLRSLRFGNAVSSEWIQPMKGFRNLSYVQFGSRHPSFETTMRVDTNTIACINLAKETMKHSPGQKTILVEYSSWSWVGIDQPEYWSKTIDFKV